MRRRHITLPRHMPLLILMPAYYAAATITPLYYLLRYAYAITPALRYGVITPMARSGILQYYAIADYCRSY